jgi:cation:H+ antiporter
MEHFLLLLGGGLLLYFGAEWLVGGAASLALSLRVPQIIVGLTVVAYGTSAPEVIVGIQAAFSGHGQVALGNVIGSNIANLGLVLGTSVLIRPARVDGDLGRRELPVLVLSTLCLPALLWDGEVRTWEGLLLLAAAIAYTAAMVLRSRSKAIIAEATRDAAIAAEAADAAGAPDQRASRARQAGIALAGLVVLLVGGHLFVLGATSLARTLGISERMLGLTIVAVGTSLPELVTSVLAALRGHSDIAVGNVIGSNIFNVLLCLGVSALAGDIVPEPGTNLADLAALTLATLVGAFFLRSARTMTRWEGATLLAVYAGFTLYLIAAG